MRLTPILLSLTLLFGCGKSEPEKTAEAPVVEPPVAAVAPPAQVPAAAAVRERHRLAPSECAEPESFHAPGQIKNPVQNTPVQQELSRSENSFRALSCLTGEGGAQRRVG